MRNLLLIAIVLALSIPLMAQGGAGGGGGGGGPGGGGGGGGGVGGAGQGGGGGNRWRREPMRKEREDRDREQRRNGGPQGAGAEDIGWGEDGTEERIEPGDTVKDADKTKRLESEADKLGLEDKKLRKEFIKIAKDAWVKSEKEDRRYHSAWKKVKSDDEAAKKEKDKHKEELATVWKAADEKLAADTILTSDQIGEFRTNTEDLRTETATDRSHRQDEIRARKEKERKDRMEEWRKGQAGGDKGNDDKDKKEKKEEGED